LEEFKGNTNASEIGEGIKGVSSLRVYYRYGWWHHRGRSVMICNHHIEPHLLRPFHLSNGADAAIHGNHQADPFFMKPSQGSVVKTISLFDTTWDIWCDFSAQGGETLGEKSSGGDAVSIEVSIYCDELSGKQGTIDPGYRLLHIRKKERVAKETLVRSEERFNLGRVDDATIIEKLSH
jgi:hypothetical protein